MTLNDFLSALKTEGVKVTLVDVEGNELIKFFSEGYKGVESDILARTIKKFDLTSANALTVIINEATTDNSSHAEPYTGTSNF